jgi:potassium-transporting ATPase KdpC subunit
MRNIWRAIRLTIVFAVLLGLIYPLIVTGIGNLLFPYQAEGSLVKSNGHIVGSELIAQAVTSPGLFHPRPSAVNYAGNGSGGSNLGPTNPALVKEVRNNLKKGGLSGSVPTSSIPTDMVESSGSGLDPDLTIQDASLQIPRISKATGLSQADLKSLVSTYTQNSFLGIWGEPMVNVMQLNLALQSKLK